MTYYVGTMPAGEHLSHHGIKGMKWGQRRYQNPDGSLTAAGRVRYGVSNAYSRVRSGARNAAGRSKSWYKKNEKQIKRAAKIAGGVAAVAGTAYLGKRYGKGAVRAAKRLGRAAPFKAHAVGNKARTAYAKGVVNTKHFGKKAKSAARDFVADVRTRRAASNSSKGYERIKRTLNGVPSGSSAFKSAARKAGSSVKRGINNTNDFFKGTRGAIKRRAKSVSGAASSAARGAGYQARRAGAKAKNAARNAKNIPGNAKRVAYNLKNNKMYRRFAAARTLPKLLDASVRVSTGAAYYRAARSMGASKKAAAAIGTARAVGGTRAGLGAAGTYGMYNVAKRANSPSAKRARARRKKKKSRK